MDIPVTLTGKQAVEIAAMLGYAALALPETSRRSRLKAARLESVVKKAIAAAQEMDDE